MRLRRAGEDFAHEAGHAVVGRFVKISAPVEISFYLRRGSDGRLYLGDFATSFPFPPDDQVPDLRVRDTPGSNHSI